MKFSKIIVEEDLRDHPATLRARKLFPQAEFHLVDRYDKFWGQVKKPYLQKRENLYLFLANKKGQLVKEAPEAYAGQAGLHYYFYNAFNCIYECEYCYLQGYFQTPDIVLFLNHDQIVNEIETLARQYVESAPGTALWFHAGEFSDSLALSHITQEYEIYWETFQKNPNLHLELRTKSANVKSLAGLPPLPNVHISFSLSTAEAMKEFDLKTPTLKARINALKTLAIQGHSLGLHFDPIVLTPEWEDQFLTLVEQLKKESIFSQVAYCSLGVVRYPTQIFHQVKKNYPTSRIHQGSLHPTPDGQVKYPLAVRNRAFRFARQALETAGVEPERIYRSMEGATS